MDSYKKLCTEFYNLTMPEPHENSMAFYLPRAQQAQGSVLEPMCGSGRYLLAMLQQGIDIDGTDASRDMLSSCRSRCTERGFKPTLRHQLLQDLDLLRKYGFVFIPGGSIGLIVDEDQVKESLRRIYEHLLPGGLFSVEIETPTAQPKTSGVWDGRWVNRPDGARIVLSSLNQYDSERRVNRSIARYELIKDGGLIETEFESLEVHYYELPEFHDLLQEAGFRNTKAYNRYTHSEAAPDDPAVVFDCRRP